MQTIIKMKEGKIKSRRRKMMMKMVIFNIFLQTMKSFLVKLKAKESRKRLHMASQHITLNSNLSKTVLTENSTKNHFYLF